MQTTQTTSQLVLATGTTRSGVREIARAAGYGALLGYGMAILYGVIFAAFATLRAAPQIAMRLNGAEGTVATIIQVGFAILAASLGVAVLLACFAALVAAVTMAVARGLTIWLAPAGQPQAAAIIGLLVAGAVLVGLSLLVWQLSGSYFAQLWPGGYLFWIGLPCLLFMVAAGWANQRLPSGGH